ARIETGEGAADVLHPCPHRGRHPEDLGGAGHPRLAEVIVDVALDLVELLTDGGLILRRQLGHLIAHYAERRLEGVSLSAGVGAGSLQQLAVVVKLAVDSFHQRLYLQRITQPESLLMPLMYPSQFAAQQMQRTQTIDDLEHEAQHQTRGG